MRRVWGPLLLGLALAACDAQVSESQRAMEKWVGLSAADVAVQTLDGEAQPLKDVRMFEGADAKPIVLNVWATWCAPCLKEMPTLDALGKSGRAIVVAIATDKDAQTVKDFLKQQSWGSGIQVWHDSAGVVTRAKLGAAALPVTYVLDKDYTIRIVEAGDRDWSAAKMWNKIEVAVQ